FITDKKQELRIETFNSKNNTVKFIGIDSVDDAKKLTNRQIFTSKEDTKKQCKLDEKQYFWFDIQNCKIIENDEILGVVTDIQRMPLSDYLQIQTSEELQDKKYSDIFLLPYIDDFIIKVDIEDKIIYVKKAKEILEAS
ncbi:MAG: ribosome maturation factor RimM, partial [Campylobacterota bacterium]|nr:ribosome maturation factor RimM [Campylobacterota bacterium]